MKYTHELITSRANPLVKWGASLSDKKGRDDARSFILEGEKLTYEAIEAGLPITHIFISEDREQKILSKLTPLLDGGKNEDVRIITLSKSAFDKISTEKSPQGVISVSKYLDFFNINDIIYNKDFSILPDERIIVLCSVRDPLNLGSVIRSAAAFEADRIVITSDCADVYNPKTVRSAMGSLFKVKISRVESLADFISHIQALGRRAFCAELRAGARSIKEIGLKSSDVIVIGNEGHGIPEEISMLCDGSVYIPISKKTESLNASVAAAIFMWEQNK